MGTAHLVAAGFDRHLDRADRVLEEVPLEEHVAGVGATPTVF
jgi:hypothetical protein